MIFSNQLEAEVFNISKDPLHEMGYDIVRIRMLQSREGKVLQIMIERLDDGVLTIDDCETASKYLSVLFDGSGALDEEYTLEISSAGLDAPLTRIKDFKDVMQYSENIKLVTKLPIDSRRRFKGKVVSVSDDEVISVKDSDLKAVIDISFANISEAHIDCIWEEKLKKGVKKK